jgi:esterase/lipase superfamily enzyme
MALESWRWYTPRLRQQVRLSRWGHYGQPVLLFPTASGDAEECERFQLIDSLEPLLATKRIKVYSIDSVAGAAWTGGHHHPLHCAWLQNRFDEFIYAEVVPAIQTDCMTDDIEIVTAGASIGAFNAVASICRHPDVFRRAIGMSGTYDLSHRLYGEWSDDFYFSSPIHYLPNLGEGEQLHRLRQRQVVLATSQGRWESPGETWKIAHILGTKGVPNRVDLWGPEWDHDWPTWRRMLPQYLDEIV